MDFERKRRPIQEINLTPLIDIVFHLMVFVMFTTTFVVSESMELSLPSAHAKRESSAVAQIMRIQITRDGSYTIDQQPTNANGLSNALADRLAGDPDTRIAIFTTPGVSVQQLVGVMDTVYLTGGRNVQVDKVE